MISGISRVLSLSPSLVGTARVMAAVGLLAFASSAARADISFVDSFRNLTYNQTGNGNTLTSSGGFFSAELTATTANNYTFVQMTYPGSGSPVNLSQTNPTTYLYQTGSFATKAAMDAAFPTGIYQFNASNGPAASTSYQYSTDDYAQSLPYLTGTDYSSLQGMNAANPFTFHFSPFVTGGAANSSILFFTVFDLTTNTPVFNAGFLAPTTTSVTLGANTLAAGHHYGYELDFSNRDLVPSPGADFAAQLGFDVRTSGTFTTAVPEPSAFLIMASAMGLCGLGYVVRQRGV